MKILTVIGARPQFIKAAVVSRAIADYNKMINNRQSTINELILHTGQHFDANMSAIFFDQLSIPRPDYRLDIHGGNHGEMTGQMLAEIEKVLLAEKPARLLVYGDTNSTLAGALAAAKLHIPVAHIEAGLRSFNKKMPEEINRILTDQLSDLLFCPTETAIKNLENEGFVSSTYQQVLNVGDVMQDAALFYQNIAVQPVIPGNKKLTANNYVLATLHRAENTDDPKRLKAIFAALAEIAKETTVVLPLHPRTKQKLESINYKSETSNPKLTFIDPVGYLEMIWLLKHSSLVLTDSGGVQKEAFFFGKACVTMRDQTEWVELVDIGANELVGADKEKIIAATARNMGRLIEDSHQLYGGGKAAEKIVDCILRQDSFSTNYGIV